MTPSGKIPFREKIGYSLGDTASNIFWQTFSFFLLYFYTDVFGIAAAAAGTMFLITRIWDTLLDPVMGVIADRTDSRWGKFRPYLLWTALPFGLIGVFTFITPDLGPAGKLIYAYVTYSMMMTVYTVINIPYSALMAVMSPDSHERTKLASFRFVAAFAGGLMVQYSANDMVEFYGRGNEALGWQWTMTVYAAVAALLFLISFATTRERVLPPKSQKSNLKEDIVNLCKNGPWVILFGAGICLMSYVSIRNGTIIYYFKYLVNDREIHLFGNVWQVSHGKLASMFMVIGSIANIVGVLFAPVVARYVGKVRGYILMMVLASVLTAIYWILAPGDVIWMFVLQILISLVMGPMSPILWSMYTDATDYSEWKYGRRATGLVMSASTMAQKFGWTIGGGIAGWLLAAYGFRANITQSADSITGITLMMSLFPAVGGILGAFLMFFYRLDNKTMKKIEEDLEQRRRDLES